MAKNRIGILIVVLVGIIVVLLAVVVYTLLLKPTFNSYVVSKQIETYNQGVRDTVAYIFSDINQNSYTQITLDNQTLFLAPVQVQQSQEGGQ